MPTYVHSGMREIASTVAAWLGDGHRVVVATVVTTRRSSPRLPGSAMALREDGTIVGSVTGGCVEPDVVTRGEAILNGASAELATYGIADAEAFEIGLPCGGEVEIMIEPATAEVFGPIAAALDDERPIAFVTDLTGPHPGAARAVGADDPEDPVASPLLGLGVTDVVETEDRRVFVHSLVPRPAMYVLGAIDFASALAELGSFAGYRVTVCDPREAFVTPERFPVVDELVLRWPHEFLAEAPVDARTAICVLTHDDKFDVPALKAALATPAGYIGAMGSRRTTERRRERLIADGVGEDQLARIHAPIGLSIGSKTPQEVAVAIVAEVVQVSRANMEVAHPAAA